MVRRAVALSHVACLVAGRSAHHAEPASRGSDPVGEGPNSELRAELAGDPGLRRRCSGQPIRRLKLEGDTAGEEVHHLPGQPAGGSLSGEAGTERVAGELRGVEPGPASCSNPPRSTATGRVSGSSGVPSSASSRSTAVSSLPSESTTRAVIAVVVRRASNPIDRPLPNAKIMPAPDTGAVAAARAEACRSRSRRG